MAINTFRVGDRVQLNEGGFGIVTGDYGNELRIRVDGPSHGFDTVVYRSQIRRVLAKSEAVASVNDIGEWKRYGENMWYREGSPVQAHRNGAYWGTCPHTGTTYSCPDAAREAADAHLVSQGRLPAERAFVRLGEWEDMGSAFATGRWVRRQSRGAMPLTQHASCDKGREEGDAHLVSMGWLDPSRAFKATTENTPNTMTRIPPERHNSVPPEVARAAKPVWSHDGGTQITVMPLGGSTYTIPTGYSPEHVASKINADTNAPVTATVKHGAVSLEQKALGPAKPTWGEWERIGVAFVRRPSDRGAMPIATYADRWEIGGEKQANATDIDDAREKADAFLVARGELKAGRAFKRVGDWTTTMPVGDGHDRLWEVQGVCVRMRGGEVVAGVARGLVTSGFYAHSHGAHVHGASATAQDAQQLADAELVRRGLLAEERAFKVAATLTTAIGIDYASAHGDMSTTVVVNKRADGVNEVVGYAQDLSNLSDDEINAMYGKNSEVARVLIGAKRFSEQGRTTTVVSGDGKPLGTYYAITPDDIKRAEERIAAKQTVTIATWEHHLPHLLSGAPREFRDGFNRRQGPAWEAYLRALAWVKEEIGRPPQTGLTVKATVLVARQTAYGYLGPEWVKANVR